MESLISDLVKSYEKGALSRRHLIQSLAALAGAGAAGRSPALGFQANAGATPAMQASTLDHVSIQVKDLDRTVNFYQNVFGLPLLNEDKKTKTVRLKVGTSRLVFRNFEPYGQVDHIALGIAHLDKAAVSEKLQKQGVPPLETKDPLEFHVMDPDGYPVQIISLDNR